MTKNIDTKIRGISHDLIQLKMLGDPTHQAAKIQVAPRIIDRKATDPLTPEKLFQHFAGNQITRPESKVLEASHALQGVELLERLAQLGVLKIVEKKRSRAIKLRSTGAALRYMFQNKTQLNSTNLAFLENQLLKPIDSSWENLLKILNEKTEDTLPSCITTLMVLFIDLGVLNMREEDQNFFVSDPSASPPFESEYIDTLKESISGFIPVYVTRLYEVMIGLSEERNAKVIQEQLEMGASSMSGILNMLSKFELVTKGDEKGQYQLTKKGEESVAQGEEGFVKGLRGILKQNPIFEETLKYARERSEPEFGFNDLVGYFRASGVPNFNPAKALAVLRLMVQTGYEIRKVEEEGKSGFFEVDEK